MNGKILRSCFVALVLILVGCSNGANLDQGPQLPKPSSSSFAPKGTYNISMDGAKSAVLSALAASQIAVRSATENQISTDYVEGPWGTNGNALLVLRSDKSRYRFDIFLVRLSDSQTQIEIKPAFEAATLVSGDTMTSIPYRDYSAANPETIANLRNWLFERLEMQLQR